MTLLSFPLKTLTTALMLTALSGTLAFAHPHETDKKKSKDVCPPRQKNGKGDGQGRY